MAPQSSTGNTGKTQGASTESTPEKKAKNKIMISFVVVDKLFHSSQGFLYGFLVSFHLLL